MANIQASSLRTSHFTTHLDLGAKRAQAAAASHKCLQWLPMAVHQWLCTSDYAPMAMHRVETLSRAGSCAADNCQHLRYQTTD
jgi:hypothetical protein